MKQSKKSGRYKSSKKMAYGHTSLRLTEDTCRPKLGKLKKRPKSMVTLPSHRLLSDPDLIGRQHHRRNTLGGEKPPKFKPGRRGSRQKSPGSGTHSPLHGPDEPRRKKKKDDKKRKQDRAQKASATKENLGSSTSSLNPTQVSVAIPPLLEEKDEEEKHKKTTILSASPSHSEYSDISSVVDVTASLRGHSGSFTSRHDRRLSTADLENIRRARSDAHLLNFGRTNGEGREERHHVCPPERKQFYRQILKRINTGTRHRIEPVQGGMQHVSRLRSENLALGNPFGPMWEQIWQEIQTFLGDMTREEYDQFKYKIGEQVEAIISRVMRFKVGGGGLDIGGGPFDISKVHHSSQDNVMQAVARKLTYSAESATELQSLGRESSGTLVDEWDGDDDRQQPSSGGRRCRFAVGPSSAAAGDSSITRRPPPCATAADGDTATASKSAADAKSACKSSSKCKYCFDQFLSEEQLTALDEVDDLLDKMYTLESRYPNRKRLVEEHPRYNEVHFKVRHVALVLWFKITTSLADKLCSLSVWLETSVVVPDICREIEGGHMTIGEASNMLSDLSSPQLSPKSPRITRGFILGASDSGSENTPTSSLKKSHGFPRSNAIDVMKSIPPSLLSPGSVDVTKSLLLDQNAGPYRDFVNRGLKRKGLTYTVKVSTV